MSTRTSPGPPWVVIFTTVGTAIGLFDFAVMVWLGADLTVAGRDVTYAMFSLFALSYGALGWAVGRLVVEGQRSRRDAETIAHQLRELERTQRALVQQEKLAALGRLAAGVAHEVRNPLGVIRASAGVVQESFEPGEDPHRACAFICEEIDRLDALIDGLLSFARPTELALSAASIEKVADRALQLAASELARREIALVRQGDAAGVELRADPDLLAQVVYDLVLNAAQAIGEGGRVELRIGVRGEGERLCVDVADDGPGVDPAALAEIFEPFVTTKATGTGLGLPMARRIVEAHGGSLSALSGAGAGAGGQGACFRIELPLPSAAAREEQA